MSSLPSPSALQGVSIQPEPEGILYCQFNSPERSAIDEWATWIEQWQLQGLWYGKAVIRLLIDCRAIEKQPLRYFLECLSDYNREYPMLTPPHLRLAYVSPDGVPVLSLFGVLADLIEGLEAEFFEASAYTQARAWLMSDLAPLPRPQDDSSESDWH